MNDGLSLNARNRADDHERYPEKYRGMKRDVTLKNGRDAVDTECDTERKSGQYPLLLGKVHSTHGNRDDDYDRERKVPTAWVEKFAKTTSLSQHAWRDARAG